MKRSEHLHTWTEAVAAFLARKHLERRKSTATTAERLTAFAGLDSAPLESIDNAAIDRAIAAHLPPGRSNATRNRYLAAASAVLRFAAAKGWITAAPKIDWLPEPEGRVRYLTRDEAARLISAITAPHLRAMVRFSLATGLRRANVTGLQWDNVSIAHRRAIVWGEEMKGGRRLPIPLNDDAIEVLIERARLRDQETLRGRASPYVFTYRGERIFHTNSTAWRRALEKASIKDFRWHDLRHTWATWHAIGNTPPRVLQQLGGWSSFTMVERYGHIPQEYAAGFAANAALTVSPAPKARTVTEVPLKAGWLVGLESSTIRCLSPKVPA